MNTKDLQGKLVAVLGFGVEGKAITTYLLKHGIKPVLFDSRVWKVFEEEDQNFIKNLGLNFIFGPDSLKELSGFDIIFRSPGIPNSKFANYISKECTLTSQTKWFFENCPCKIIGITGTKGKGTTSTLTYEIIKQSYKNKNIYLIGNIGKTPGFEILDDLKKDDLIVYELSSFQLQNLNISPHISVVLMTTSEHLDYHKDIQEYHEAKSSITKYQGPNDYTVYNINYPASIKIGQMGLGQKITVSNQEILESGCFIQNEEIIIKNVVGNNFKFPVSKVKLPGKHNLENICAAVAASLVAGADQESVISAVSDFNGLEHRLELVKEVRGIKFYNDSFSTTPETAIAAINSFNEPEIIILGGSTKNSDFTELGTTIVNRTNIKTIILIGQEAKNIELAINQAGKFTGQLITGASTMGEIFDQIKSAAQKGDIVLLSPACASFGMFKNYKDRGVQFKNMVEKFN